MNDRYDPKNWLEFFQTMPFPGESIKKASKEVRFGWRADIYPRPGPSLNCYVAPTGLVPYPALKPNLLFAQRVITLTAADLEQYSYMPGSWVLTIRARPIGNVAADAPFDGNLRITPIVARITIGSGAVAHTFEIDAVNSSIALPSRDVQVDVGISQIIGTEVFGEDVGLYDHYEVVAIMQKTTECGAGTPTRSIINLLGGEITYQIPEFASAWCIVPMNLLEYGDNMFALPTSVFFFPNAPPGNIILPASGAAAQCETVAADIASQMGRTHCFRKLHPQALSMFTNMLQTSPPLPDYPCTAIFEIGF